MSLRLMCALSTSIFLSACGTDSALLGEAYRTQAEAGVADQAIALAEANREAARKWPDLPGACRKRSRSGVKAGDRLDVALLKTDFALGEANNRQAYCNGWYDRNGGRR